MAIALIDSGKKSDEVKEEIEEALQRSNRLIDCQQTEICLSGIVVGGMMTSK